MNVGDFFVSIGVKGAESAGKALKSTKDGLGEIKSMSLETKAAIAGTLFFFEKLMSNSAQMGTDLKNLSAYTGMSTKALQQWGWAAQQVGVNGKEAQQSLVAVAKTVGEARMGNAPAGWAMVAKNVGLDKNRLNDTQYVMQQLQKFAQLKMDPAIQNQMLASFGLSQNMISAMRQSAFTTEKLGKAQYVMTDGMIQSTAKAGVAWENLGSKIEFAFAKFTAKHGTSIVSDLSKIIDKVILLTEALIKLAEKAKLFETVGQTVQGATAITEFTSGEKSIGGERYAPGATKLDKGKKFVSEIHEAWGGFQQEYNEDMAKQYGLKNNPNGETWGDRISTWFKNTMAPSAPGGGGGTGTNIEINQELNFSHDGRNAGQTGDSVKKAVKESVYQLPAAISHNR